MEAAEAADTQAEVFKAMKNIWTGKRKGGYGRLIIPAVLFIGAAVMVMYGLDNTSSADERYMAENQRQSIIRAAALCYSSEGSYPENLEYLEDNYGVYVNDDKYTVHYSYVGGNIPPEVIVTVRKG